MTEMAENFCNGLQTAGNFFEWLKMAEIAAFGLKVMEKAEHN